MPTGLQTVMRGAGGFNPFSMAGLLFFNSYDTVVPTGGVVANSTTHGPYPRRCITGTAPNFTINLAGGLSSYYAGGSVTLAGYANPGNNGTFTITAADGTSANYVNAAGVREPATAGPDAPTSAVVTIPGQCNAYTDLKSGHAFTQSTASAQYAVNTSMVPGRRVLGCLTQVARILGSYLNPTLGSLLNGTGDYTLFLYWHPTQLGISGNTTTWQSWDDTTPVSFIRSIVGVASGSKNVDVSGNPAAVTNYTRTWTEPTGTWHSLAVTHTGTTVEWFLDGVSQGTATGTQRTRSGLNRVLLSMGGGGAGFRAVDCAFSRVLSAGEIGKLTAWSRANYA